MAWVEYKDGSPVQMANALFAGLKDQGRNDLVALHQGAEETEPDFEGDRRFEVGFSSSYRMGPGGTMEQREVAAAFQNNFLGLGVATKENTFLVMNNGRNGLYNALLVETMPAYYRVGYKPGMALEELNWPMIADLANDAMIDHQFPQKIRRDGFDHEFARTVQLHDLDEIPRRDRPILAAGYSNRPSNPQSLYGTPREMRAYQEQLNTINARRLSGGYPTVMHVADIPYFAGLPQKAEGSILASAYEGMAQHDDETPTVFVTSFAKAFGMATPGAHAITFSDTKMAKRFENWGKSKILFSYFPEAMAKLVAHMHPDRYPDLKEHFGFIAGKYAHNLGIFRNPLGRYMLEGDPGMVFTIELPEEVMGKKVRLSDGSEFVSRNARKVAEYAANVHGAVAVDQSIQLPSGGERPLIRFAIKSENPEAMERGARGYAATIEEFQAAPSI